MHPDSSIKRTKQFATCRFGGLDYSPDISNGNLQDGEFWNCPLRGQCKHEGVLCKLPVVNEVRLTNLDIKIL